MTVTLDERTGSTVRHDEVLRAIRTVMVYTLTDVFELAEEESMWVSYHVENILAQVANLRPRALASPVRLELQTGEYSKKLSACLENERQPRKANDHTVTADVNDWTMVLADIITQTYRPRPMVESAIRGHISGVLIELGVGHPVNPRASRYLPNAVRYAINAGNANL